MTLPIDLVFIRHGQSEANVVQQREKREPSFMPPSDFTDRHDWQYRLSDAGRAQARAAGAVFDGALTNYFDVGYVSPFIRARETAALVGGPGFSWLIDDRLRERDWGIYGTVRAADRAELFPHTEKQRERSPWYAHMDGGESLATSVFARVRDFVGTLHRERSDQRVVVVTHGEFMWTARYVLERMLPEEWEALDADYSNRIRNCTLLEYTRRDPLTGTLQGRIGWRRIRYTDSPSSPHRGQWQPLGGRRFFTGEQLGAMAEAVPPLGA
jgi:broad specificity phosphatase PhoE